MRPLDRLLDALNQAYVIGLEEWLDSEAGWTEFQLTLLIVLPADMSNTIGRGIGIG